MFSRHLKCTYKPSLHRINCILNCHYVLAGMYVYLATQPQCYHCLLVSSWTLIAITLNDSLDFSVFKRGKCFLDSTWEWMLSWFWGLLHGTTCKITGMQLGDFQPKHQTEGVMPAPLPGKRPLDGTGHSSGVGDSTISVASLQTNHGANYKRC